MHRLEALRRLRSRYGIYLLSNTNPVMWNTEIARQFRGEGREREDYFDGMVTSFEARVMKPEAAIFDYAAEKLGIVPAETLFLDDSQKIARQHAPLAGTPPVSNPARNLPIFSNRSVYEQPQNHHHHRHV